MAGKGGGAWKVAYADFVTAMMAFFLVMWLTAQDQQIKKAVSYYFMDPLGNSKKVVKSGSVAEHPQSGTVPMAQSVQQGKGRQGHTTPDEPSPSTKTISDWLSNDKEATAYWKQQAIKALDAAKRSPEVKNKVATENEVAVANLSKQLRDEIRDGVSNRTKGVYLDLLLTSFNDVNWKEIAEDLLAH